jgi:hypothetical protein
MVWKLHEQVFFFDANDCSNTAQRRCRFAVILDQHYEHGLEFSMTRIYIYAAIALAFGGLLLRDHIKTKQLNAARAENTQLTATLETERKAREHERAIAKKASDDYQARLDAISAAPDLGPVRLCKRPRVPAATEAGATSGADEAATRHVEEPDAQDIGPQLNDFVKDCEANAAQLQALQGWIESR